MKIIVLATAALLGSLTLVSAHTRGAHEEPAYAASSSATTYGLFAIPQQRDHRHADSAGQTLTGGPSGGPNQS